VHLGLQRKEIAKSATNWSLARNYVSWKSMLSAQAKMTYVLRLILCSSAQSPTEPEPSAPPNKALRLPGSGLRPNGGVIGLRSSRRPVAGS
jgi:hypothetical protein